MAKFNNEKILAILEKYKEIRALSSLSALATWDLETYMPEKGIQERGLALAKVERLTQKLLSDPELKNLVYQDYGDLTLAEQAVLRSLRREIEILEKLPPDFIEEFRRITTEASIVWRKAKEESNFQAFAPYLEKIVDFSKKKAEYLGFEDHPYSALLDLHEEGWKTSDVEQVFNALKPELKELFEKIKLSPNYKERLPLEEEEYSQEGMKKLNEYVLSLLNWDRSRLRVDVSAHPFTLGMGVNDVRITTWYHKKDFRRSLLATVHEFGHALYELNIDPEFSFTPLEGGVSYGIHESQSRFWENIIAKNPIFLEKIYPKAQEFLPFLKNYSFEDFCFYFNFVRPEFLRVESDELTYHFHIILRFEIEKRFLEGSLQVKEARDFWLAKMEEYLGIKPPTDSAGILQDIHWSMGAIGYFPTYSLGTFLTALWKEAIEKELGKIDSLLEEKEGITKIQNWLREKIHCQGKVCLPKDLVKQVTGKDFEVATFINYLKEKYSPIYLD